MHTLSLDNWTGDKVHSGPGFKTQWGRIQDTCRGAWYEDMTGGTGKIEKAILSLSETEVFDDQENYYTHNESSILRTT